MIKAIIFDMDGLIIDSEPLWRDAEVEVFGAVGVPLSQEMMKQTMGLRIDEVVDYWYSRHPWHSPSKNEVADNIETRVIELIRLQGAAMPGVNQAIQLCVSSDLPIAVASSSSLKLIDTVINKLGITKDISVACSAHNVSHGKPHPAVFLATLDEINRVLSADIHADQCLVFEDSINGIIAAKAAKMKCVAIPHPELKSDKRLGIADVILPSLDELSTEVLKKVNAK